MQTGIFLILEAEGLVNGSGKGCVSEWRMVMAALGRWAEILDMTASSNGCGRGSTMTHSRYDWDAGGCLEKSA